MQNLAQLRYFQLVAAEGSFARAAELAHISQPALSNAIKSLETKLGMKLFERAERPIEMTPAAKSILPQVEAILFEAQNLEQTLQNLSTGQTGHIRLGMTAVFTTSLAGPILAEWHSAHRNVSLDLVVQETTEMVVAMRDDQLDLIVGDCRDLREDAADLELRDLPLQSGGAFCRAGHPILDIRNPRGEDLARYRLAGTHFPAAVLKALSDYIGRADDPSHPLIAINSHNIAALRDAVAESDLILLSTAGTVRNALALGVLRQIPIDMRIDGEWAVATRRGRVLHPAVGSLIEKIRETALRERDRRMVPYVERLPDLKRARE